MDAFKQSLVQLYWDACRSPPIEGFASPIHRRIHAFFSCPIVSQMPELVRQLIAHIRDVEHGKGEWHISYDMLYTWFSLDPHAYTCSLDDSSIYVNCLRDFIQYGSWKDMKYFAGYVLKQSNRPHHPLIGACIRLFNDQLTVDLASHSTVSHAAKWVPRESSTYSWLFYRLASDWASRHRPYYQRHATTQPQKQSAMRKSLGEYRRMVSRLAAHPAKEIGERTLLYTLDSFVKRSLEIIEARKHVVDEGAFDWTVHHQTMLLQNSWEKYVASVSDEAVLGNLLPVMDISKTMHEHNQFAYRNAMGMACFLCQKMNPFRRRIITIDYHPSWIDLSSCATLVDMIDTILSSSRGNTVPRIKNTFAMLKTAVASASLPETEPLDVVVLSNMSWLADSIEDLTDDFFYDTNISLVLWKICNGSTDTYSPVSIPASLYMRPKIAMYSGISPLLCSRLLEQRHWVPHVRDQTAYSSILQTLFTTRR